MKRICIFFWLFVVAAGTAAQTIDTIQSRCNRYYYSEWYDQCDHYIHPPDYLLYPQKTFSFFSPDGYGDDSLWSVYVSDYTTTPLEIRGIAVMLSSFHWPQYEDDGNGNIRVNYASGERLPEYVMLYQQKDDDSTKGTLLDSIRWDTATVHMLRLPQNELEPDNDVLHLFCYVYEAYFETPVTINGRFLLGGTMFNNGLDNQLYIPSHHPTTYLFVSDDAYGCDTCHGYYRRFYYSHKDSTGLMPDRNRSHLRTILGGPFLAIVNNPQPQQYVTITAQPNNPFWGHVSGGGTYLPGDSIVLSAEAADESYLFLGWDDGVSEATRIMVTTSDTTVTALFEPVDAIVVPSARNLDFKIVPNPARERVTISTGDEGDYTLTLYDQGGRKMMRQEFHGSSCQLDTAHLPAGTYLIVLQSSDGRGVKVFIKQ